MSRKNLYRIMSAEIKRLDSISASKRHETVITGFSEESDGSPRALISGKPYLVFNSNDYLGLRLNPDLAEAEHVATKKYGTGPGAVRFISGTLDVHQDLEAALAKFHGRSGCLLFSSAFAANLAIISSLIKGQSKDSLVSADTLVISDELNHRSIVEGIRVANLPSENRLVFKHLDPAHLEELLVANAGKFARCLVVTDGVFSMLGQFQKLDELRTVVDRYELRYPEGTILFTDDCHGIGACGATGRGTEELLNVKSDVLVGTLGKAFGTDGGYVVADQPIIDYLRESCATYIYSNPISPGTAAAALAAVRLMDSEKGRKIQKKLAGNIALFKKEMAKTPVVFAADTVHPIQPLLMGDPQLSKKLQAFLFENGVLVTSINYPVVPKGQDEIRVQISSAHTDSDLKYFAEKCKDFFNAQK